MISRHYVRYSRVEASKLTLWNPFHADVGRRHCRINVGDLIADTDLECIQNHKVIMLMLDREIWRVDFVAATRLGTRL